MPRSHLLRLGAVSALVLVGGCARAATNAPPPAAEAPAVHVRLAPGDSDSKDRDARLERCVVVLKQRLAHLPEGAHARVTRTGDGIQGDLPGADAATLERLPPVL